MFNLKSSSKLSATLLALILGASVFMAGQVWAAKYVTDPTTGKVVSAPEYGGTLTYARNSNPPSADVWFTHHSASAIMGVVEKLALGDWGISRSEFNFQTQAIPASSQRGMLAESWEQQDPLTIVFKIRQGVNWHNKAPVNGRALVAADVAYNWNRILGLGKFSEAGPSPALKLPAKYVSVTAPDDGTVVFKLAEPSLFGLSGILVNFVANIYPPEVIEEHGDVQDWRNVVGTGPFMLTDWIEDSSLTWTKNPNYWGFDEKFPENRLPYVDQFRGLIMKEVATRIAALRSGKIDHLGYSGSTQILSIDQAERLRETNPEVVMWDFSYRSETSGAFATWRKPFDDVRVRHAMQMGLDLETINGTYFKGYAEWIPSGLLGRGLAQYRTPFAEWPAEIQKYYQYDPEGAGKLLDEAGYPLNDDGIRFKTTFEVWEGRDIGYFELAVAYWSAIGVEVELMPLEGATHVANIHNHTFEGLVGGELGFDTSNPIGLYKALLYTGGTWNRPNVSDPMLDKMIDDAAASMNINDLQEAVNRIDMYQIEKHWFFWGPRVPNFQVFQPWIIGFNGEYDLGSMDRGGFIFARLWIDQDLKKEMGF